MKPPLDPRWDWVDVSALGEAPGTTFVKSQCNHLQVVPVHDVTGTLVARLCITCDSAWYVDP